MKKFVTLIISIVLLLLLVVSLQKLQQKRAGQDVANLAANEAELSSSKIDEIKASGKLRVAVINNSTDYFSYKGRMMGLKYEALNSLCKKLDVQLEVYVQAQLDDVITALNAGKIDLIAQDIAITLDRKRIVDFTIPTMYSDLVLVQRKPEDWHLLSAKELKTEMLQTQLDLAGKEVVVPASSNYSQRLKHLALEIGDSIKVVEDSLLTVEALIAELAKGKINYTVAQRNVAEVNQGYYRNIDIHLPVSFKQKYAWVVAKEHDEWLQYLNSWLSNFLPSAEYRSLYAKYYTRRKSYMSPQNIYTNISGGCLSEYDDLIKAKSEQYLFDWRLIAAIIYTESGFNSEANSWAGAIGLMQIMPEAAETFNVSSYAEPSQNLEAGMRFLTWLNKIYEDEIPNPEERLKFVLASYNVGLGHVRDAQRLAQKYGKIRIVWDGNVDYFIRHKSESKYYLDPVVQYGYCRGEEPYRYVSKVLDAYHHYCNLLPEPSDSIKNSLSAIQ